MAQSGGMVLTTPPPPGLQEATKNSTHTWQEHLESLFHHAKERFPDVVWELVGDGEGESKGFEDVWGHKGAALSLVFFFVLILPQSSSNCICTSTAKFPKSLFLSSTKWRQLAYPIFLIAQFSWRIRPFAQFRGHFSCRFSVHDSWSNNPSSHQHFHQPRSFFQ